MPIFGLTYYTVVLLVVLLWSTGSSKVNEKILITLGTLGAFVSISLVTYTYLRYGGFCPWCSASATASLILFASLNLVDTTYEWRFKRRDLQWELPIIIAVSLLLVGGLERSQRESGVDLSALKKLRRDQLFLTQRGISTQSQPSKKKLVIFADLGCGTCRNTLRRLRQSNDTVSCCLRFVPPMTDYSRETALTYLSAKTDSERNAILSDLLEDDSRTIQPIFRLRRRLGLNGPTPAAYLLLGLDNRLSEVLKIKSYPVEMVWDGSEAKIISIGEILETR